MANYIIARKGNLGFLRQELQSKLTNSVIIGHRKQIRYVDESDKVIRYGCVAKNLHGRNIPILNPARYITHNFDKENSRNILRLAGVPVPQNRNTPPCIGRPTNHSRGRQFYICNTDSDMAEAKHAGATYFSDIIQKKAEYRVHVAHGYVLVVQEKVHNNPNLDKSKIMVWNHNNGFLFEVLEWNKIPRGLNPIAISAVKAMGLDFGAVDIMYGRSFTDKNQKEDKFFVSEINTAPRLENYTAQKYAEYFDWWISQVEAGNAPEHREYEGGKTMWRNMN